MVKIVYSERTPYIEIRDSVYCAPCTLNPLQVVQSSVVVNGTAQIKLRPVLHTKVNSLFLKQETSLQRVGSAVDSLRLVQEGATVDGKKMYRGPR